jgi:hypothetical protein
MSAIQFDETQDLIKSLRQNDDSRRTAYPASAGTGHGATLDQARRLMQQGQYENARTLLQTIEDHPRAQQWLATLADMLDEPSSEGKTTKSIAELAAKVPQNYRTVLPVSNTPGKSGAAHSYAGLVTDLFTRCSLGVFILGELLYIALLALMTLAGRAGDYFNNNGSVRRPRKNDAAVRLSEEIERLKEHLRHITASDPQ